MAKITNPIAVQFRQFSAQELQDPSVINGYLQEHVTETMRLGGSLGIIILRDAIDMGGHQIKNAADPTDPQDLVTKAYADKTYQKV